MNDEIVSLIQQRGVLLQRELFELLQKLNDVNLAKSILDTLEQASGQKMINGASLTNRAEYVFTNIRKLPDDVKDIVETTLVTIGLSIEVKKVSATVESQVKGAYKKQSQDYQVFYPDTKNTKKLEVADFVGHFRSRYQQIQRILMQRPDLQNLVSINKLPRDRQRFSLIGIVSEKRVTKNKNLSIVFEDLTGRVSALVKAESECFSKASELQLDDVVAIKASGNQDMIFIHDVIYPDSFKEKVRFDNDCCVAFVSDIHAGSNKHLGKEFQGFLDWLNGGEELAKSIKYIFFVGDNIDGVGIFPGQERLLNLKSMKEQYNLIASYIKQIPSNVTMFMCPGQHDSVRVAEPQPVIDNIYGESLYQFPNLVLVTNPTLVKLLEGEKEFKVLMYHGASMHVLINEIEELRLLKAHKCPAKAVKHMLKRRHLASTHGVSTSIVYVPNAQRDPLVIADVPDVLCTGEVHRLDIENYNGTMIITGSCWQSQTEFEEKVGNVPDPCKVPVLNLKTRELKILDFSAA